MTNITPEAKPTSTLARLGKLILDSIRINPMIDTGILFKEPTRENVVGVVVERNHNTENEIPNPTKPVKEATKMKAGLYKSG